MQSADRVHSTWRTAPPLGTPRGPGPLGLPLQASGPSGRGQCPSYPSAQGSWVSRWSRTGSLLDKKTAGTPAALRAARQGPAPRARGRGGQKQLVQLSRKQQRKEGGRGSPRLPIQP